VSADTGRNPSRYRVTITEVTRYEVTVDAHDVEEAEDLGVQALLANKTSFIAVDEREAVATLVAT
jgi:hypothetical protein